MMRGQTGASESLAFPFLRPSLMILHGFGYEPNTQQLPHTKNGQLVTTGQLMKSVSYLWYIISTVK